MKTGELLQHIEVEINDTERRVQFWRDQERLQAGSPLQTHIRELVDGYDRQLEHLEHARRMLAG